MAPVKVQSNLAYQNSSVKFEMWKVWIKLKFYFFRLQRETNRWNFRVNLICQIWDSWEEFYKYFLAFQTQQMEIGTFKNTSKFRGLHQTWDETYKSLNLSSKQNIYIKKPAN